MAISADDIKKGLTAFLKADAGLTAEIGARLYAGVAPTSAAYPYITYERITSNPDHHMLASSGLNPATFELNIYGDKSKKVFDASEALRLAVDGFQRAKMGDVEVSSATIQNERDNFNKPTKAKEIGTHITTVDLTIWYRQTVPTF